MGTTADKELKLKVDHFFSSVLEKKSEPVYYEIIRGYISHAPEDVRLFVKKHYKGEELLNYFKHRPNYFNVNWHKEVSLKKKQSEADHSPVTPLGVSSANDVRQETCCKNENYVYKDEIQTPKCENGQLPCSNNSEHPGSPRCLVNKGASSSHTDVNQNSKPPCNRWLELERRVISWFVDFLCHHKKVHFRHIGDETSRVIKAIMKSKNLHGGVVDFFKGHVDIFTVNESGFIALQKYPPSSSTYLASVNKTKADMPQSSIQDNVQKTYVQKNSQEKSPNVSRIEPRGFSVSSQKVTEDTSIRENNDKSTSGIYSSATKSKDFNISSERNASPKTSSFTTGPEDFSKTSQERSEKKSAGKISSEKTSSPNASCSSAGPMDFSECSQKIPEERNEEIVSTASPLCTSYSPSENNRSPDEKKSNVNVKEIFAVCFFADILCQQGPVYLENLRKTGASLPNFSWCSKLKTGKFKKLLQNYPYLFVIKHNTEVSLCNCYEEKLKHLKEKIMYPSANKQNVDDISDSSHEKKQDINEISSDNSTAYTISYTSKHFNTDSVEKNAETMHNDKCPTNTDSVEKNAKTMHNDDKCPINTDSVEKNTKTMHNYDNYPTNTVSLSPKTLLREKCEDCSATTVSRNNSNTDTENNNLNGTDSPKNDEQSMLPVHNEIIHDNNCSTIVSVNKKNNNNQSDGPCAPESNNPSIFPVCNKITNGNTSSVGEHAKLLVVWMAELLCFQIYEANKEAKDEAECRAVKYFISEIKNYSQNFIQKSAPYVFLKGKLGQAPSGVPNYINRWYPGKHFNVFFREHSEFRALPDSALLHPPSCSKISKKNSRSAGSISDFNGFQKLYYTEDFLRLFCAVHDTIKKFVFFICNKVNVPLNRLAGKLGSLGPAEQELLKLFEGQSSIQKVKLFLSHFDIIFSIRDQNVSIYEGSDALLDALRNYIFVCVVHSLVNNGHNTAEKLMEAVCSSYPQMLHNVSDLEDFIAKNSSFAINGDVIVSKFCDLTNSGVLVEVLNLIKENLQDRPFMCYTELLSVVKSRPQLLSQMIGEMPVSLMYTLKSDEAVLSKEGKVSVKSSLRSDMEKKSPAVSNGSAVGDMADILEFHAKSPFVSVENTKSVKTLDYVDSIRPKEFCLKPEAGSLQNSIRHLKVRPKVLRTFSEKSEVKDFLHSESLNKLLVAVNHFKIESSTLTCVHSCTIKLELVYLRISEFHHMYPLVKINKLLFCCIGKPTEKWTMQELVSFIYEKFRRRYNDLFCIETTTTDIHSKFFHFLHCLAVLKFKLLGKTSKKEDDSTTCMNMKSGQHIEGNVKMFAVENSTSIFQKEDVRGPLEIPSQSSEEEVGHGVTNKKLSFKENVSDDVLTTSNNLKPDSGKGLFIYSEKVKNSDANIISGLADQQEKCLSREAYNLNETIHGDEIFPSLCDEQEKMNGQARSSINLNDNVHDEDSYFDIIPSLADEVEKCLSREAHNLNETIHGDEIFSSLCDEQERLNGQAHSSVNLNDNVHDEKTYFDTIPSLADEVENCLSNEALDANEAVHDDECNFDVFTSLTDEVENCLSNEALDANEAVHDDECNFDVFTSLGDEQERLSSEVHNSVNLNGIHDDDYKNSELNFQKCSVSDITGEMPTKASNGFHSPHTECFSETNQILNQNEGNSLCNISSRNGQNSETTNSKICGLPEMVEDKDVCNTINRALGMHIISVVGKVLLLTKDCGMAEISVLSNKHWVYFLKSVFTCTHRSFAKLKLGEKVNCLVPESEPESKIRLAYLVAPICCQENLPTPPGVMKIPPTDDSGMCSPSGNNQDLLSVESTHNQEIVGYVSQINDVLAPEFPAEDVSSGSIYSVPSSNQMQQNSVKFDKELSHECDIIHCTASVECLHDNNIQNDKDLCGNRISPVNGNVMQGHMADEYCSEQQNLEPRGSTSQGIGNGSVDVQCGHRDVSCQTISTGLVIMSDFYCE